MPFAYLSPAKMRKESRFIRTLRANEGNRGRDARGAQSFRSDRGNDHVAHTLTHSRRGRLARPGPQ